MSNKRLKKEEREKKRKGAIGSSLIALVLKSEKLKKRERIEEGRRPGGVGD